MREAWGTDSTRAGGNRFPSGRFRNQKPFGQILAARDSESAARECR